MQSFSSNLKKNIFTFEFRIFFRSDRLNEMNFQDPVFRFGVPYLGVLDIWWVETPRRHPSYYTLSIGVIDLQENFSCTCRLCAGYRKIRRFCSGSVHVRNLRNFLTTAESLSTHLWICHKDCGDLLYITGLIVQFRHYKNEVVFVWPKI